MDLNATSITEVILLYPKLKISKHIIDLIICFGEAPFIQHWFACNSDESTPKGDQCLRDLFRCYGLRLVFEWWYLFSSVKARFTHQVVLATEVYLLVWLTVKTWNHYIRARDPEISDHQAQPTDNVWLRLFYVKYTHLQREGFCQTVQCLSTRGYKRSHPPIYLHQRLPFFHKNRVPWHAFCPCSILCSPQLSTNYHHLYNHTYFLITMMILGLDEICYESMNVTTKKPKPKHILDDSVSLSIISTRK